MVGPPAVGKTSLKSVVFEGKDPNDLINNALSPTRGIISSNYKWIDIQIGIFDTSGQELPNLLNEEVVQLSMFENAEIIIYMLDYHNWTSNSVRILDDIKKLKEIIEKYNIKAELIIVFHKMDLISYKIKGILQLISNNINAQLAFPSPLRVLFSSLVPELLNTCFITFSDILSSFSKESSRVKNIVDSIVKKHSRTGVFITDKSHEIIIQSFSEDFDLNFIHPIYRSIPLLSSSSKSKIISESGVFLIDKLYPALNFTMDKINTDGMTFNTILSFSETNKKEYLDDLLKTIIKKL